MGKADKYQHGTHNAICDTCGFKYKASQLRMTWDGFFVCDPCWEPRHPQDFVRGKVDKLRVDIVRPDNDILYHETTLNANESAGDTSINVVTMTEISQYTALLIQLDPMMGQTSQYHACTVTTTPIVSTNILITPALPWAASSGNQIYILDHADYIQATEVTVDDL
jgi:hypothetical protein